MVAGDVAPLQLLSNTSLSSATLLTLQVRGPNGIVAILSGVTAGATILSYPGGTAAPGFWVSYTTTAFDFPTSGRYEVSIVATLAGIMRVTAVIPLVVDASANSS